MYFLYGDESVQICLIACLYVYCHWRSINQYVGFLPVPCQDLGFQHHICRALCVFNGMRWEVILCLVVICVFYRHSLDFILRFLKKLNCTIIYNYIYMEEKPLRYNKRKQNPDKRLGERPDTWDETVSHYYHSLGLVVWLCIVVLPELP
jgi:hypothetical protein